MAEPSPEMERFTASLPSPHPEGGWVHYHEVERTLSVIRLERNMFEEQRNRANERLREVEGKLESGYSFCHPEDDCEGRKAFFAERERVEQALVACYANDRYRLAIAHLCDEHLDPTGELLGRVRDRARMESREEA